MLLGELLKDQKESLYKKTKDWNPQKVKDAKYEKGDKLKIVSGPMEGKEATFVKESGLGPHRVYIMVEGEEKQVPVGIITKDAKKKTKDTDVTININIGSGEKVVELPPPVEPIGKEPQETASNTGGTVYKGYTIKQENEGDFNVYSIGGALIGTFASLELAMNEINGLSLEE